MQEIVYHKTCTGAVLAKTAEGGGFEGYASTWFNIDRHGDLVMPGAYQDGLKKFLDENFVGGAGHDWNRPIGRYYSAKEDVTGLYVKAKYSDVEAAREVRTLINDGVIQKLSVGMRLKSIQHLKPKAVEALWSKHGYSPTDEDMEELGRLDVVRVIHKAQLLEVSPVTVPANDNAKIMAYKSAPGGVSAYLTRIEATAKSIAKKDPEDVRISAIVQSVRQLLATVEALQSYETEEDMMESKEMDEEKEMDEDEAMKADAGIARTKARLAIALATLKQRGIR